MNDVTFFKLRKTCGYFPLSLLIQANRSYYQQWRRHYASQNRKLFKGACVYYGALEWKVFACPVNALAIQFKHIWVHTSDRTTILCAYWDNVGRSDVTDRDIRFHMKFAASKWVYPEGIYRWIGLTPIQTVQAGMCNENNRIWWLEYEKMGRRLPLLHAFLEYTQKQLLGLYQGMANKMSRIAIFRNMEGSAYHTG